MLDAAVAYLATAVAASMALAPFQLMQSWAVRMTATTTVLPPVNSLEIRVLLSGPMLKGSRPRFVCAFTSQVPPGGPVDPDVVVCRVKDPTGTVTEYDYNPGVIARDAVGQYHLDLTLSLAGNYSVRWEGSGALVAVGEITLTVQNSVVV